MQPVAHGMCPAQLPAALPDAPTRQGTRHGIAHRTRSHSRQSAAHVTGGGAHCTLGSHANNTEAIIYYISNYICKNIL